MRNTDRFKKGDETSKFYESPVCQIKNKDIDVKFKLNHTPLNTEL